MRARTARSPRTPSPPPNRPAGSGTSACRRAAASAMSIPAAISPTTRPSANCAPISGRRGKDLAVRKIPIRSGHRETFWKRNCVAVGLAAGFLEPLEASAIVLIELSAKLIAEQMPACREVMDVVAKRFNATTHYRWGRIIDFLKLHYVLTKRDRQRVLARQRAARNHPRSAAGTAAAVGISVALVPRRIRPGRGSVSRRQLSIRALRHGLSHRGRCADPGPRRGHCPSAQRRTMPGRPNVFAQACRVTAN